MQTLFHLFRIGKCGDFVKQNEEQAGEVLSIEMHSIKPNLSLKIFFFLIQSFFNTIF